MLGKFLTSVTSSTKKNEKLKFGEIRDFVLNESIRRKDSDVSESSGNALTVRGRRNSGSSGRGRSKSRGRNMEQVLCWNCGDRGHFRRDCPKPKKSSHNDQDSVYSVEDFGDALTVCVDKLEGGWVIDSGASFHSSSSKEAFSNFVSGRFGRVRLANGHNLKVLGRGDVNIKTSKGGTWRLKNVRYIPSLTKNLVSVS